MADGVYGLEPTRVVPRELLKLLSEKHVLVTVYAENKGHACLVLGITQDSLGELVDGSDTCSACDKGDVSVGVGLPLVAWDGGGEEELVSWREGMKMAAGFSVGVFLDKKVYISWFVCVFVSSREGVR